MTTEDVNPCDRETLIDYAVHRCDTANKLAEHHSWRAIACLSTGDTGGDAALREALRHERRWQIFVAVIRDMRKCSFTREAHAAYAAAEAACADVAASDVWIDERVARIRGVAGGLKVR